MAVYSPFIDLKIPYFKCKMKSNVMSLVSKPNQCLYLDKIITLTDI